MHVKNSTSVVFLLPYQLSGDSEADGITGPSLLSLLA